MAIFLLSLFGSPSIGVYFVATDDIAIVPPRAPEAKADDIGEWLGVEVAKTTIGRSIVVGALVCANSHGLVVPRSILDEEKERLEAVTEDANLVIMDTKRTAYGNLVLANDHGAIVDPRLKAGTISKIADALGVEVVKGEIAGLPYNGSLALATGKGVLAHPLIKEEERQLMEDVLKVPVDVGSINCGIPYVATGLVGNSENVIAGSLTTGPEIFIIGQALDVVE